MLFLGASDETSPLAVVRGAAYVIVLDRDFERLASVRRQALERGLDHVFVARVVNSLRVPLPDASVDLIVVPGLGEWFLRVGGRRRMPAARAGALFSELRRVLAPGGQVYVAADNRLGLLRLVGQPRRACTTYTATVLRRAAEAAGFAECHLFAPLPFRHKFHQIIDLERGDTMNFCANPYRVRGRAVRSLVRAWEVCNGHVDLERRLYPFLPGFAAVLSTDRDVPSFAQRILAHVGAAGTPLARYYVRGRGTAVLVAGGEENDGRVVRLPLDRAAEQSCAHHHRALSALAIDTRIPPLLRALFPTPLGEGVLSGQPYFVESAMSGDSGRLYYARPQRRYDRATIAAGAVLGMLRRTTESDATIDDAEFERLCGGWLAELADMLGEDQRALLERVAASLRRTLVGRTLALGWYHGDYDFANLLYGPDDEVCGIIDFELFEPRGLPLIDHLVLLASRPVRQRNVGFGTLFLESILPRRLPPLEAELLDVELRRLGVDDELYRALALCCWLEHVRLRRDAWLQRSVRWRRENLDAVLHGLRSTV